MDTHIWNILGKYVKGESDQEEQALLQQWLDESTENPKILKDVTDIWEKTGRLDTSSWAPKVNLDEEWQAFKNLASKDTRDDQTLANDKQDPEGKTTSFPIWIYRIAAAVVLGFGLIYFFNYTGGPVVGDQLTVYATDQIKTKVLLPDSSEVWLNKQSELSYAAGFGRSHRNLTLTGEAYFDIKKNEIPFIILSHQTQTEVLGTAFNLRSYAHEESVSLALVRGKVAFSEQQDSDNRVTLGVGEQATLSKSTRHIKKTKLNDKNVLAWKNDVLDFKKTKLDKVLPTLEKYFNVEIKVKNLQLYNCRFTGKFYNPDLNNVLEVLAASLNLTYTTQGHAITLQGAGCSNN